MSGDVITEFDGKAIKDTRELVRIVGDSPVGKTVSIKVLRGGKKLSLSVKLGRLEDNIVNKRPSRQQKKELEFAGMVISDLDNELASKFNLDKEVGGVIIIDVKAGSLAAEKGLRKGDVIIQVDQVKVENISQISKLNDKAKSEGRSSILMLILREGLRRFVGMSVQ